MSSPSTTPSHKRVIRRQLKLRQHALTRRLLASHLASAETSTLTPSEPDAARAGSKPLLVLERGREKFVLKLAEPALAAAEIAAHELRTLGYRPSVPCKLVKVDVADVGVLEGLLKPFLEFDGERELDADTRTWSELARTAILIEHPWEWLLDNLDANTSQYALLEPDGYPLNIDWDRSFASEYASQLTRFEKYKRTLPNARTFLYSDYVEGRIALDFRMLLSEVDHIRRLPTRELERIVRRYAAVAFADDPERADRVTARAVQRKRAISADFRRFVGDLVRERRKITGEPADLPSRLSIVATRLWNHAQIPINSLLRGPVGSGGRKLLSYARGIRRGQVQENG